VDGNTGEATPLLDVSKTRRALMIALGVDPPYEGLPFESVIELSDGRYLFSFQGYRFKLSTHDYAIEMHHSKSPDCIDEVSLLYGLSPGDRTIPRLYRRAMWTIEQMLVAEAPSPDRSWFASVSDGNIVLRSPVDDRTVALTSDGTEDFSWDIEAPRFKVKPGMDLGQHVLDPWSADGYRLFAIKIDRRTVPNLPLIRYLKREDELCTLKVQRAGGPIDICYPHAVDVLSRRAVPFDLGNTEDQIFTLVGWLPDGSSVLFTRHSRDFKKVDLLAGNPTDGSIRTVLSESAKTFVAIQHEVIYSGDNHVVILPDGSGLLWRSSRSGWNHFYLYAIDGTLLRALTEGEFPVIDVVGVDQVNDWIYFSAHHDQQRPYDTHLCRVRLSGSEVERLTRCDGDNAVSLSPSKETFTVVNSRPDRPFRTDFHASDGKALCILEKADISVLESLGYIASEEFTVMAADGKTQLWGVMHKPGDFDPSKTYPLIDHIYGGPQVTMTAHRFSLGEDSLSRLDRALAQLGYVVITLDARGTPERSKAFHDVVYGNWGRYEIPDHVAAIKELAARYTFIDRGRVGVWGHSWGGYFTIRALAMAPEIFRVGVAVAPGDGNPRDGLILYEPYMDLPIRAKRAYEFANNHLCANRITGKLMMIAGTSDAVCYPAALKMAHYLIESGVDHEFVVLPEGYHSFTGKDDEYVVHKLVKHFETHLKPLQAD
jgi:dipeptidyl aminopeptidase/acylaminoacyl peptidase